MFVFNFRLRNVKRLLAALAVAFLAAAVIFIICTASAHGTNTTATCDELGEYSLCAKNSGEEIEFLQSFGIEADAQSRSVKNIVIPFEFNAAYTNYNSLQKQIGLDLERYAGESAEQITYEIKDGKYKYAVLVVCGGKVIGGHITNGEYGGKNEPLNALWKD